MTLFDLLDPLFDPADSFLAATDPTQLEWDPARSNLLGQDGPRLTDPLAEERDSGR